VNRRILLVAAGVIVVAAAALYLTRTRYSDGTKSAVPSVAVIDPPFVMFRTLSPKDLHGHVAMARASAADSTRYVSSLACSRVAYAAGSGICLVEEPAGTEVKHAAYIFDRGFRQAMRIELSGIPTRARVSPDGRRAAITVYGEEHLPNGEERLAISSFIVDVASGDAVNLRKFSIDNSGGPILEGPLDFSSVAFAHDSNRFFATLATTNERYIVAGTLDDRRLTVLATGLASEALSPDDTRLAVKKRVGDRGRWQLMVFDLAARSTQPLNQGDRSVDDQVEWLDGEHVVYHDATEQGTNLWVLSTDGVTPPRVLIPDAYSPSVAH
jgi:hypothetical protein